MVRFKKTRTIAGLCVLLLISSIVTSFANQVVYEKVEEEIISSGVTYKNILRFTKNGWLNVNVVYFDLKDQHTELKLLQSQGGLSTRETLSSMTKREDNVVASMNADFFMMQTPSSPIGAIVEDGKMISSPVSGEELATFYINKDNQAFADYWDYNIYVTTDKGKKIELGSINKYRWEYRDIMLVDRNWGTHSPGATEKYWDMVEIVVENDKVVEVRNRQASVEIPENGYVLLAAAAKSYELYNNLQVGDTVTVHTDVKPNIDNIKLAFGGGTVLVRNGQVVPFTQSVAGAHPRTALGITKDRSKLIFVTIDGRHTSYNGVDGKQLAEILIELGSYEAIIMDGGGSTTMMKRGQGEFDPKIINYLSDGAERRIINGVAIVATSPTDSLRGIKAEIDDEKGFIGASRKIIVKAFDRNYNPMDVDYSKVNLSLKTGEGRFDGMNFTPSRSGKVIINVEYLGTSSEVTLDVLKELSHINISPRTARLKYGEKIYFDIFGVDKEGYKFKINPKDIIWNDTEGLGSFKDGVYTAGNKDGASKLEARFGGQLDTINLVIGANKSILNNFETLNTSFVSYPELVTGSISLDPNAKEGTSSLKLKYDFTKTDVTRAAYIAFDSNSTVISNPANSIGVWAYAFEPATHWIRGRLKDAKGTEHVVDFRKNIDWTGWKYLTASLPSNMTYPVKFERLYVVETDARQKVSGEILFDSLEVLYNIDLASNKEPIIKDKLNRPYEVKGERLFVHSGVEPKSYTLLDTIIANRISSLINNNYGLSLFTGNVDSRLGNDIKKQVIATKTGYSSKEHGNNLIIQLDTSKGSIRQSNFDQWPWLQNLVNTTNKKNVFVVMSKPIFGSGGFTDKLEADLLMNTLTALYEKGKQVFVLYEGQNVSVDVINDVRYISTGVYNSKNVKNPQDAFKYVEFNINENQVTYQIKPLFQ